MKKKAQYGQREWFEDKLRTGGYQEAGAYYGHAVNGYQVFRYQYLVDCLSDLVESELVNDILDVGCGVGDFAALVRHVFPGAKVEGVDFVEPAVAVAAERFPEIRFTSDSLPRLRKIGGKFDLIIASEVLYYLDQRERRKAVERLHSLLRKNGRLLVSATLAPHTFTEASLREVAGPFFSIRKVWIQNSRIYLKLIRMFDLAMKLESASYSDEWGTGVKIGFRIFHAPLVGGLLSRINKAVVFISRPILRSVWLPRALTHVGNAIGPRIAGSNIVALMQRRSVAADD